MAEPPRPYDALTLSIECAKLGGIAVCAFKFPAGAKLDGSIYGKPFEREHWHAAAHIHVTDNKGVRRFGTDAVLAIASQQISTQCVAQIIGIDHVNRRECECRSCAFFRNTNELSKLIGQHPSEDPT